MRSDRPRQGSPSTHQASHRPPRPNRSHARRPLWPSSGQLMTNQCLTVMVHNPQVSRAVETAVPPDKQTLRRQLRAQRRSRAPERDRRADADAIAAAASALLDTVCLPAPSPGEHPAYDGQPCVAIYRSLPTEPPTQALAEMLHARSVAVIVPEMLPDKDLDWHQLRADGSEGPGLGLEAIAAARVILTPALAVDHSGTRLGQGGGSYDRALARRRPDAVLVAIVNDEEYAARPLPRDTHDVPVNAVITPGSGLSPIPGAGSVA
jgi:5-formyltetrahydrofolate cyclo-ligase